MHYADTVAQAKAASSEPPMLLVVKRLLDPSLVAFTLFAVVNLHGEKFGGLLLLLGVLAFIVSAHVFEEFDVFAHRSWQMPQVISHVIRLLTGWGAVVGILAFLGYVTGIQGEFSPYILLTWVLVTPLALFFAHCLMRYLVFRLYAPKMIRSAIILGANEVGWRLARRINSTGGLMIKVDGFFDDRGASRSLPELRDLVSGGLKDAVEYVRSHGTNIVYITLPIINQPRVQELIGRLRDTAASLYFVPDIFIFDLVQARLGDINGIPVIAVFESPFTGVNALLKRFTDLVLASVFLMLSAPLMLAIALGIKLTSPGPVIFVQRRCGMDGDEIRVYKFRSMTVCEDGATVAQATKGDARITPLGGFLRRTSLDELPQFVNVLQGRMSVVGPRPHAVVHDEMYRKLIKGYMGRLKVKPGITGLAQVNGCRGETDTLDKMESRVRYDIEYLRRWSILLDLQIVLQTIRLTICDKQAY